MGDFLRPAFPVERRGYDRVQVERYLDSVEYDVETLRSRVEKLEAELEGARKPAETTPDDPASQDRYAPVSDHVAQLTQALDEEIEQLRAQANEEIEQLRAQANEEVEQLRAQANEEVERRLSEVRADADRIQAEAESKANEVGKLADDGLREAHKAADAIQGDAQERAEETFATAGAFLNEARQQADRVLSDLKDRRRSLYGKLRRIRNAVDGALSELDPEIDEERPADEVVLLEDEGSDESVDR
jgi:cell division septum initiation protein DivIVA